MIILLPEFLSLEYLTTEEEGQYLDRKSARIKPSDIARHLVAFANANGGVLIIGVEDDGKITGFNSNASRSINDFLKFLFLFVKGKSELNMKLEL